GGSCCRPPSRFCNPMSTLTLLLIIVGGVIVVVSTIWTVVLAFQRHWGWGLAVLLVPFANVAFLFVAWQEARRPFFWYLASLVLFAMAWFSLPDTRIT